jgi:hypothetical protein
MVHVALDRIRPRWVKTSLAQAFAPIYEVHADWPNRFYLSGRFHIRDFRLRIFEFWPISYQSWAGLFRLLGHYYLKFFCFKDFCFSIF